MTSLSTGSTSHTAPSANTAHPSLKWIARTGYAARGVVYLIIGVLSLLAALGMGGDTEGSRGALRTLAGQTWGQVALGIIALGLLAHASWRFLQSALDADNHGADAKGITVRAGLFVSAFTYLLLAAYAGSLIFGGIAGFAGAGGGDQSGGAGGSAGGGTREATAWLMSQPYGVWLVGLVGVAIIGAGVAQFIKGVKTKFEKWLQLDPKTMEKVSPICRTGLIARGITFFIIGGFVIVAAVQAEPSEARGLGGALQTLREQAYGPWLLGAVAIGLIAFAIYSFIEAWSRKINMPTSNG